MLDSEIKQILTLKIMLLSYATNRFCVFAELYLNYKTICSLNMKKFVSLVFITLLNSSVFASETISFEMILMGNKIGDLKITRTLTNDGLETYALQSTAKAKILWIDKSQKTNYMVVYKNGVLISSDHSYIENTGTIPIAKSDIPSKGTIFKKWQEVHAKYYSLVECFENVF